MLYNHFFYWCSSVFSVKKKLIWCKINDKSQTNLKYIFILTFRPLTYEGPYSKLSTRNCMEGLDVLMNSLYFQNNKKIYKQIDGLPIGLSVSQIIVYIVLQDLVEVFLSRYQKSIKFYGRYVDDSFIVIAKNKLNMLMNSKNSFHNSLQFTYEKEHNSQNNFLDIMVIKNSNGALILFIQETYILRKISQFLFSSLDSHKDRNS